MNHERPVLYINILIHDVSEAVKDRVNAKAKGMLMGPLSTTMANRAAARAAGDFGAASKVAKKLGPKLCEEIPVKMKKQGIRVHVEEVFQDGNYLVIELQVQHVDAVVMASKKKRQNPKDSSSGDSTVSTGSNGSRVEGTGTSSGFISGFYCLIGMKHRDHLEQNLLPSIVQGTISASMAEMLQDKLTAKKMQADTEVLQQEKQARFFFQKLREVREATASPSPRKHHRLTNSNATS